MVPQVLGHSTGGLIAQHLLGAGVGRAAVALAPLPAGSTQHPGHEPLSPVWFRHVVANAVGEEEATELFDRYAVPAPLRLLTDLGRGAADTVVDTANSARGPLLLVSGQEDRLVPDAVTRAVYKLYGDSSAVTDLKQFADRGHSLVFDGGWSPVADHVLAWLAANGVGGVAAKG
ncbi:alpha/beta hydrolase [Kitasatospora aureofaciens]|uniref:alpha/beta hydrolase n=1 Tax=Kitasatospora aureofaciens TaxID=1894 RepID=UPI0037C54BA2